MEEHTQERTIKLIAGPCSVESREQLNAVVARLKEIPEVSVIRAGVWKPRTRPGGFEGLGELALQWMSEVSRQHGVEFCCEVAMPEHVELCLQYGIKQVWIGARTTGNPFMVDEIGVAMRGSDIEVMVKNPMFPDVRLWLGAIERMRKSGITRVSAVHRGFATFGLSEVEGEDEAGYRNEPLWEVAMELRRQAPEIPILCDPSHIGGDRKWVEPLSQAAMQLGYDGLMVEVHPSPDAAWTDAKQQLSPDEFEAMVDHLSMLQTDPSESIAARLASLRHQIDDVDHQLIRLLGRRMELSRRIAAIKRDGNLTIYQPKRWDAVVSDRVALAGRSGVDPQFARDLMEKIHAESLRVQLEN